ncbi:hypothetical protein KTO58_22500 [Chitinophaga pendula]|uniref:DUF5522 domain-containing protein n=1 Tax=Chitinophaga TaxID=79328 RepID=UPI000BAFF151|nr:MULTISPECIES: DUF5522 domain-containing protein [Chitinophaga]ASZ10612.1 hypothetical protein CK934_06280 [Chitinophaga sp. MD30]UCJ06413.1 hypothetical protein KTO58_22500 [Chitinophaga pendula]
MKQSPLVEKIDFYYNEAGYMVFTEKYHRDRGYCCGNGCKHCPFDYEKVPEPKRSALLAKRKETGNHQ